MRRKLRIYRAAGCYAFVMSVTSDARMLYDETSTLQLPHHDRGFRLLVMGALLGT